MYTMLKCLRKATTCLNRQRIHLVNCGRHVECHPYLLCDVSEQFEAERNDSSRFDVGGTNDPWLGGFFGNRSALSSAIRVGSKLCLILQKKMPLYHVC